MLYSVAKAAALVALLCPSVLSIAIDSQARTPEVPWKHKKRGLLDLNGRDYPSSCTNGPTTRSCWDGGLSIDTDMDQKWPTTGRTVKYNFEITNVTKSPDGFARPMAVINGQYPGPALVADWGDEIEVTVTNSLTTNGTGIHWHGLRQLGSNEMDGVPGLTECPIPPGGTKVYRFQATQYGTSWYHSHYSVQYADGVLGPIVIRGPTTKNYDVDLGALPLTDWFHTPSFTVNAAALHANGPPIADNYLVNGSMTSQFGGQYSVTTLTPGKTHLLRFINTGINNWAHVGIDGHELTVVAADFVPIVPYTTSSLSIAVGQRYDVIISANQTVGNYWLRVGTGGGTCDGPNNNAANIGAIIRYAGAPAENPTSTAASPLPTGCYDESVVPYVKTQVPQQTPQELTLGFTATAAQPNLVQWLIDGTPMLIDFEHPTLQAIQEGNQTFNKQENVYTVGEANKWQYWVIQQNQSIPAALPHPIHLHGHDFYVIGQQENAEWSGDISSLKMDNPIRRDTATLPTKGYLVLAFESDNPGTWLMHCHIPFHISAGLGLQFLERRSEIIGSIGSLDDMNAQCKDWTKFQSEVYPNGWTQGDSGL